MGPWGPTRLYLNKIYKKMYVKRNFFQELLKLHGTVGYMDKDLLITVHKPHCPNTLQSIDF
jgi:hypothetical protein